MALLFHGNSTLLPLSKDLSAGHQASGFKQWVGRFSGAMVGREDKSNARLKITTTWGNLIKEQTFGLPRNFTGKPTVTQSL